MNTSNIPDLSDNSFHLDLEIDFEAPEPEPIRNSQVKKLRVTDRVREQLEKKAYRIAGEHSAVQICSWTKKSIINGGDTHCYKQRFYGINCHKCAQMTPTVAWCTERCTFCWRPMEFYKTVEISSDMVDSPREIIEGIIEKRRDLLIGFKGREGIDLDFIEDALQPDHWAISLSGEPTMYPRLPELIRMLHEEYGARSTFLVTNAQDTEMIQRLWDEDSLPSQIYFSLVGPNEAIFKEITRSRYKDGWNRFLKSLELMNKLPCRRIIRFTMIKGLNNNHKYIKQYQALFNLALPDFIEVKSYMHIGYSQKRLKAGNMPLHDQCIAFSKELTNHIPYTIVDDVPQSRIVLLRRDSYEGTQHIESFN